tara:strand:- start:1617 stop:1850 length:234 start_codon:yes stop_codon:yes gene_type:complete
MSSEVHKYIETALNTKKDLLEADIIAFPREKKMNSLDDWQLYNKLDVKEDGDQLKTVIGICFVFSTLAILGLYSYLI